MLVEVRVVGGGERVSGADGEPSSMGAGSAGDASDGERSGDDASRDAVASMTATSCPVNDGVGVT